MNDYKVSVREYLERTVTIEANSEDEAIQKVKEMYRDEEIVLSSEDFISKEIDIEKCYELDEKIIFVDDLNDIQYLRNMIDKQFYALDISGNGYADYLFLRKEKDTLWIVSGWEKENFKKDVCSLENNFLFEKQHCLVKFDTFQFLSFDRFYDVFIELYNAHMSYEIKGGEPDLYVIDTDLNIKELNAKVLHDQYKKQKTCKDVNIIK